MSRRRPVISVMGAGQLGILIGSRGWVLPGAGDGGTRDDSADLDVALFTGIGQARNVINVRSADVVRVCGAGGAGTASEAAHAMKTGRPLILLGAPPIWTESLESLCGVVECARDAGDCCRPIQQLLPH